MSMIDIILEEWEKLPEIFRIILGFSLTLLMCSNPGIFLVLFFAFCLLEFLSRNIDRIDPE